MGSHDSGTDTKLNETGKVKPIAHGAQILLPRINLRPHLKEHSTCHSFVLEALSKAWRIESPPSASGHSSGCTCPTTTSPQGCSKALQDALGSSRMLQGAPGCSRVLQDAPGCSRMLQPTARMLQDPSGCSKVPHGAPGCSRCSRMPQDAPGCSRMLQDGPGCSRVL